MEFSAADNIAILGHEDAVTILGTPETGTSAAIDASDFERVLLIVNPGAISASTAVEAKIQGSTATAGTYADISGASVSWTDSEDTEAKLVDARTHGAGHVKVVITATGGTSTVGLTWVLIGYKPQYQDSVQALSTGVALTTFNVA